jgi:hypothetical protein
MQRFKTALTEHAEAFLPERGRAREQLYTPGGRPEPFGLNKRTRRARRGEVVTLPNGEIAARRA